jgi:hypothetical protein
MATALSEKTHVLPDMLDAIIKNTTTASWDF